MSHSKLETLARSVLMDMPDPSRRAHALGLMTEDATWWIPGIGTLDKGELTDVLAHADTLKKAPTKLTIAGITLGESRIALECESHTELAKGGHMTLWLHFLLKERDGLICEVKEYVDTLAMAEALGGTSIL